MTEFSKEYTIDELMTVLMAREVRNDDVMIVGVATPMVWAAFTLAKLTHAPDAIIITLWEILLLLNHDRFLFFI